DFKRDLIDAIRDMPRLEYLFLRELQSILWFSNEEMAVDITLLDPILLPNLRFLRLEAMEVRNVDIFWVLGHIIVAPFTNVHLSVSDNFSNTPEASASLTNDFSLMTSNTITMFREVLNRTARIILQEGRPHRCAYQAETNNLKLHHVRLWTPLETEQLASLPDLEQMESGQLHLEMRTWPRLSRGAMRVLWDPLSLHEVTSLQLHDIGVGSPEFRWRSFLDVFMPFERRMAYSVNSLHFQRWDPNWVSEFMSVYHQPNSHSDNDDQAPPFQPTRRDFLFPNASTLSMDWTTVIGPNVPPIVHNPRRVEETTIQLQSLESVEAWQMAMVMFQKSRDIPPEHLYVPDCEERRTMMARAIAEVTSPIDDCS
ncbi:hypothetical protein EIP91_008257, partial [Steccherinum ochraceum]